MRFNLIQFLGIAMLLLAGCLFFGNHMESRRWDYRLSQLWS